MNFKILSISVSLFCSVSFAQSTQVKGEFNTFHEVGVEYVDPSPSPAPAAGSSQLESVSRPRRNSESSSSAIIVPVDIRRPDGVRCGGPAECRSNICVKQGGSRKVCASPGVTCRAQNGRCMNDNECCSNLCSSYGKCVADGKRECVPNGRKYGASPDDCCSRVGSPTTMECMPSQLQCLRLDEPCIQHSQCCSNFCSAYGSCRP